MLIDPNRAPQREKGVGGGGYKKQLLYENHNQFPLITEAGSGAGESHIIKSNCITQISSYINQ